jgi:hypothetical protein
VTLAAASNRRVVLLVVTSVALALGVIAFGPLRGDTFGSIDSAIKFLQASALASSSLHSMALPYRAAAFDPTGIFQPYEPPFTFRNAGGYEGIFPSAYALIAAGLVQFGPGALKVLSIAGAAVTAAATFRLAERGPAWIPSVLIVFATPVWFYGTQASEVTLALAASTLAFVLARREQAGVDLFCGLLIGTAAVLRDESVLVVPGLLFARYRYARATFRVLPLLIGVALPVAVFAVIDDVWLGRPMLAHLRHAAPLLNQFLPRSHALLPELPPLSWPDRYSTVVHYWLFGDGSMAVIGGALAGVALAFALRRRVAGALAVAVVVVAGVVVTWRDISPLLQEPRFIPGLFRLAPFLLFALLPFAPGAARGPARAVALVTSVTYIACMWITLSTAGGKGLGPRLIIFVWPLLVATAWDGFRSWWDWTGPRAIRGAVAAAGVVLIAASLVIELGIALPAWAGFVRTDVETLDAVRASGAQITVLTDSIDMQLVGADFKAQPAMYVARSNLWRDFSACMVASGQRTVLLVSRGPRTPESIPSFTLADDRQVGRYRLLRFVR